VVSHVRLIRQAGAIVVRRRKDGPRVLLITSKRNAEHWLFPKGHVEDGETLAKGPYVAETFPVHVENSYVIVET